MTNSNLIRCATCLALLFMACWPAVYAQQALRQSEELVNFAYSSVLGTGYYKVGDQTVFVVHLPFSKTQWKPGERGKKYGFRWLFPVNIGLHNFSWDDPVPDDRDDIGTISFLPGIELLVPLKSGWRIKPFAQYGFARDLSNNNNSRIYNAGVKTQYDIVPLTSETIGVTWGTRIAVAGFNPDTGSNDSLGQFSLGIDLRWPQKWQLISQQTYLGLFFYGNFYFDDAEFKDIIDETDTVSREFTLGFSIGGVQNFELMGIEFERVGIGYRFGPNIRAITLFSEFPF